jgi:thymidylate synthase
MQAYLDIVRRVLDQGIRKSNRTGVDTLTLPGVLFEHDLAAGFPLLTTKRIPWRLVASELAFFIKGKTDKNWLRERDNHIWDEWCSPDRVAYGHDDETRAAMKAERELGPIYGWQWRHFGAAYQGWDRPPSGQGIDQLQMLIDKLKTDPEDRRLIVSAWNPIDLPRMALPPCHYSFQVIVAAGRISLLWNQRSVDVALGLPFNIAGYGLLLHLLARESGFQEGRLIGFLGDTHIYLNHRDGLDQQLERSPRPLPVIRTDRFTSLFDWCYQDTTIEGYDPHPSIPFEIAI